MKPTHLIKISDFVQDIPQEYVKRIVYYYEYNAQIKVNHKEIQKALWMPLEEVHKLKLAPGTKRALEIYQKEMY